MLWRRRRVWIWLHALQISALLGGHWLTSCPICFTPKDKSTVPIPSPLCRPTDGLDMSVPKIQPRFNGYPYRNLGTNYIFVCYYDNMHKMKAQYSGCNLSFVRMFLQDYRNEVAENSYCGTSHNYWSTSVVTTQTKVWARRSAGAEYFLLETPSRPYLGFVSTRGNFPPLKTTAIKANKHQGCEHVEPSGVITVP